MTRSDRATTMERIARLDAAAAAFVAPLLDDIDDVDVVDGDLEVRALDREEPLVVFGALRVAGAITTWEHAHLIVLGDASAAMIACTAGLYVRGALRVDQVVYLCSGNDYSTLIEGELAAPLVIEHGMHTTVGCCTATIVTTHNRFVVGGQCVPHTEDDEEVLRALLVPEVFQPDEHGNGGVHENLLRLAGEGVRVLR
jgi:hypothetical protein